MSAPPASVAPMPPVRYFASEVHRGLLVSKETWAAKSVAEVASGTRATGNHVCRSDVCHKGRLGKKGFCRMYYFHWARYVDVKKGPQAKMRHGLPLANTRSAPSRSTSAASVCALFHS